MAKKKAAKKSSAKTRLQPLGDRVVIEGDGQLELRRERVSVGDALEPDVVVGLGRCGEGEREGARGGEHLRRLHG